MKSIALVKTELVLMREGKSVLIEHSLDSAVFKHAMEHPTPLSDYKIIRQNDKDVLILD